MLATGAAVTMLIWLLLPAGRRIRASAPGGGVGSTVRNLGRLVAGSQSSAAAQAADLMFTEVASLLRAGVPPGAAWRRAAGVEVDSLGVPDRVGLTEVVGPGPAAAMSAASHLAVRLGAPLALVLQSVDAALRLDAQMQSDREAALAGPQTTARVLLALPFLGLLLGWVLGANPIRTMISGGVGTLSFILGGVCLGIGRWWISKLVAVAAGKGSPGAAP